jgi:hypothetical protein
VRTVDATIDSAPGAPEALYTFEEPILNTRQVPDVTGNGHTGRCGIGECPNQMIHVGHGMAAAFNGDDQLTIDGFAMDVFTVAAWVRVDLEAVHMCPLSRLYQGDLNSWQLCLVLSSGSMLHLTFHTVDGVIIQRTQLAMDLGTWHHVAIRWDGTTKAIFYDGVEAVTGAGTTMFGNGSILLGRDLDVGGPVAPLIGSLDDVAIYARALTNTEVFDLTK